MEDMIASPYELITPSVRQAIIDDGTDEVD